MNPENSNNDASIPKASSVLATWCHNAESRHQATVIPDGCRDLIIERKGHSANRYLVSELSRHAYSVQISAGTHMIGLRLRPGTCVDEQRLLDWANCSDPREILETDRLDEFCERKFSTVEVLECLQSDVTSVSQAAQRLCVSSRTLQRTVKQCTGESPHFWLALARIRRACRSLGDFDRLADAAAAFGFADQAHMTREAKRWLGVIPSSIGPGTEVFARLNESGYG